MKLSYTAMVFIAFFGIAGLSADWINSFHKPKQGKCPVRTAALKRAGDRCTAAHAASFAGSGFHFQGNS